MVAAPTQPQRETRRVDCAGTFISGASVMVVTNNMTHWGDEDVVYKFACVTASCLLRGIPISRSARSSF